MRTKALLLSLLTFTCVAAVCVSNEELTPPNDIPTAARLDSQLDFIELGRGFRDAGAANVAPFRLYGADGEMTELRDRINDALAQEGWRIDDSSEPSELFYAESEYAADCLSFLDLNGTGYRSQEARRTVAARLPRPIDALGEYDLVVMVVKFDCA